MRKRTLSKKFSLAMAHAEASLEYSDIKFTKMSTSVDSAAKHAFYNQGSLFASATMLAMAVELHIKSLMVVLNLKVPRDHSLINLFKTLDESVQSEIEGYL